MSFKINSCRVTSANIGYMALTGFYDLWALVAMTVVGHRNLKTGEKTIEPSICEIDEENKS